MRSFSRINIRTKMAILILASVLIPLGATLYLFYGWGTAQLDQNAKVELTSEVDQISMVVEEYFSDQQKLILQLSANSAFQDVSPELENDAAWRSEVEGAFSYIHSLYPYALDEACLIDESGSELARIVGDKIAHKTDLSHDEKKAPFFEGSMEVDFGQVYQSQPYLSQDSGRWVLASTTPIVSNDGVNNSFAHFEMHLGGLHDLLSEWASKTGLWSLMVVDKDTKAIIINTAGTVRTDSPFSNIREEFRDEDSQNIMLNAVQDFEHGSSSIQAESRAKEQWVAYAPVNLSDGNQNNWMIVATSPAVTSADYPELMKYLVASLVLGGILLIVGLVSSDRVIASLMRRNASRVEALKGSVMVTDIARAEGSLAKSASSLLEAAGAAIKHSKETYVALHASVTSLRTGKESMAEALTGLDKFVKSHEELMNSESLDSVEVIRKNINSAMGQMDWQAGSMQEIRGALDQLSASVATTDVEAKTITHTTAHRQEASRRVEEELERISASISRDIESATEPVDSGEALETSGDRP